MDFSGFRRQIIASHSGRPQEVQVLEYAIRELENSMNQLAKLGHVFHLEPGNGSRYPSWPRRLFHVSAAPNGRMVRSEFELWDLGEGWFDSLEEAQHAEGVAASWRGKAGVNRRALPVDLGVRGTVELFNKEKAIREFKNRMAAEKETG